MKDYSDWCRKHFAALNEGGLWGIPRSGLIMRRQGDELIWVANMDADTSKQRKREQDFIVQHSHFLGAGINVRRAVEDEAEQQKIRQRLMQTARFGRYGFGIK